MTIDDGDGFIDDGEQGAVSYTVAGVDADATATVTFSDGVNPDVVVALGNSANPVDLSWLANRPITATISADDTAGNSASGTGDSSTKDAEQMSTPTWR